MLVVKQRLFFSKKKKKTTTFILELMTRFDSRGRGVLYKYV